MENEIGLFWAMLLCFLIIPILSEIPIVADIILGIIFNNKNKK
jgi:hypothetical protein